MKLPTVKAGAKFRFRIYFENLSSEDLGQIYAALRPRPQSRYKLGLGRPLGLGTVRIDRSTKVLVHKIAERYDPAHLMDSLVAHSEQVHPLACVLGDAPFRALSDKTYSGVGYPRVTRSKGGLPAPSDGESKLYEWFVANDTGSGSDATNPSRCEPQKKSMRVQLLTDSVSALPVLPYTVPLGED